MRLKILNLLVLIVVITVNALANILPINGVNTGQVSAQYDNYFTPAGFTFSIWSLIYLGLLAFVVFQFISKKYEPSKIGYWFTINGLANIAWIFAWHYSFFILTIALMMILLVSLIFINQRISNSSYWVKIPFRIYLGWICVATVANVAVFLTFSGWSGFGIPEVLWGMWLVLIAAGVGLLVLFKMGWFAVGLTIAWGIWGIYSKQVVLERADTFQSVCLVAIAVIVVASLSVWVRNRLSN